MKNGEVVRNMTDGELAKFRVYFGVCPIGMEKSCKKQKDCNSCWEKWLNKEQNFTYEITANDELVAKEL